MRLKTVCAWCGQFISEKECPETKNCQALAKDGAMTSHGICPACRQNLEIKYGLNKNGGSDNA